MNRRQWISSALALLAGHALPSWAQEKGEASYRLLNIVPFQGEGRNFMGEASGEGLLGRRALDVSRLTSRRLVTPTEQFFIRTRYPAHLDPKQPWSLKVDGLMDAPLDLPIDRLPEAEDLGTHLVECAGSTRNSGFGLMSAARWKGIPLEGLLDDWQVSAEATHALVSGVDPLEGPDRGAGWIFPLDTLRQGALGTHMNDEPLPLDHGFPLRLVMPGWYGCCWIKWLDRIQFVKGDIPSTAHMREYAGRTQQPGVPNLAVDFAPATVDAAAMPIRIEMWTGPEGVFYRIVGIAWGGERASSGLRIRIAPKSAVEVVEDYQPGDHRTWNLWSHVWRPEAAGEHVIDLAFADRALRTRRLSQGYYRRRVQIPRV